MYLAFYLLKKFWIVDRPGIFNPKGRAKWDAWNAKKGMDKEVAQKDYIKKVAQLVESIGKKWF